MLGSTLSMKVCRREARGQARPAAVKAARRSRARERRMRPGSEAGAAARPVVRIRNSPTYRREPSAVVCQTAVQHGTDRDGCPLCEGGQEGGLVPLQQPGHGLQHRSHHRLSLDRVVTCRH